MRPTLDPVVQPLPHNFETEFIQESAIHPQLYASTIEIVGDLESDISGEASTPIHDALNWRYIRFGLMVNTSLLAALFLNEDGSCWQAKLDKPKLDTQKGKVRKYETPVGNGSRAFLPAVPPTIRQLIAQHSQVQIPSGQSFWDFIESHPEIQIVLTEGGKKSLAALSQGYVALSLYGINAGVSKYVTMSGERIRRIKPELIPDLQRFAVEGRKFILAFDQDASAKTRHKVEGAIADLSWHLEQAGAQVSIASWDGQDGKCKGLDDLIVNAGAQAWGVAYDQAISANEWRIGRQLAAQVKRQADLTIGNQEFSTAVEQLPKSGIVAFYGGKGTGKSEAINLMLADRDWLSFTPLVSLGRDQAESWGGVFINDSDVIGSTLLKDGQPVKGASVCIPSLLKVSRFDGSVLVLDELTATLEFLLGSKLANKNGLRPLLLTEFTRRVQMADLVILADADLTEEAIAYIEAIREERAFLVRSDRHALTYPGSILDCSVKVAIAALLERVEVLAITQLIYINSDSKAMAESLAEILAGVGVKSLLITSETSGGDLESDFLASRGASISSLLRSGFRAIITSPTVTQGFSIKVQTDLIDSVWGFYKGGSITAHAMAQALDRVRSNDVPRFIHVAKKGSAYSRLSKAQNLKTFMKEFQQISTASARLVRHSLTPEAIAKSDAIDWQSQNLKMLASLEVRRNQGMMALRETLVALLRREGKQVEFRVPSVSKAETQAAGEALLLAQQRVRLAHAKAVAKATPIDDAEAKRLSEQPTALTPKQVLSLEQWHLAKFYQLAAVATEDVLFDKNGATQKEIRNLEAALSHAKAIERTAHSINQNPDNPQDWNRTAAQRWLMEQSGATVLIIQIIEEGMEYIELETVDAIAQFIRSQAKAFRIGFGFTKLDRMSDQQIIGILLAHCGIHRKRHRRRGTYSIDHNRLTTLLEVVNRRQQADPDPIEQDDRSGVRISLEATTQAQNTISNPPNVEQTYQFAPDVEGEFLDDGESLSA
jgi:hypothetical protein